MASLSFHGAFGPEDLAATFEGLGRGIFFVQIGAMDGVSYDPIHPFVEKLGWHGLLVEPVPYLHAQLKQNYAEAEGLVFSDHAVADFEGTIEMTILDPDTQDRDVFARGAFGTSTLMPDRGLWGGGAGVEAQQLFHKNAKKIEVPCCRLSVLLARHLITALDLLVVDTEGADWMVVRQLDLETIKPRIVYLEYNHLSAYEQQACAMHFLNYGYRIYIDKKKGENFLAIRA